MEFYDNIKQQVPSKDNDNLTILSGVGLWVMSRIRGKTFYKGTSYKQMKVFRLSSEYSCAFNFGIKKLYKFNHGKSFQCC